MPGAPRELRGAGAMSSYEWTPDWADLPDKPVGWMHSGIAFIGGHITVAHPGEPTLLFYDRAGVLHHSVKLEGMLEPHGFCAAPAGIWIDDVGFKRRPQGPSFETERSMGRVALVDEQGRLLNELEDPRANWSPTAVAVVEETGDVWVADGYGESLVHRFGGDGRLVQTLTGEEGAGRFDCPHGLVVDRRRGDAEIYVSDRANGRIQVYDAHGTFRRVAGQGIVVTPTDMAVLGNELAVTDFTQARVTILDVDDQLVEHVGANPDAPKRDGWPNAVDAGGALVRPPLESGKFNSPHTLTADVDGNLYVTEWLIGGRLAKLARHD